VVCPSRWDWFLRQEAIVSQPLKKPTPIYRRIMSSPAYHITIQLTDNKKAAAEHKNLVSQLSKDYNYTISRTKDDIANIVFASGCGLSLPRLPEPVIVLPWTPTNGIELTYLKDIYADLKIRTIMFPGSSEAPYEGASESKFFYNGSLLVLGTNKETAHRMRLLLNDIYTSYGLEPPHIIKLHPLYSYLDCAMLEVNQDTCIVQKNALLLKDVAKLKKHMTVHVIDDEDKYCLNSIVDGDNLITHPLNPQTRAMLQQLTKKKIIECDVSEFEKAGGSVRCLVLDVYDPRFVKKKRHGSAPGSPK